MKERECCNKECGWKGKESETVYLHHSSDDLLCPECHEVTEVVL